MIDPGELLVDGPREARWTIALAHGAGAPMDSPFMNHIARGLGQNGHRVLRFEFDYMQRRRLGRRRGPPDSAERLIERWHAVIDSIDDRRWLVIGGKSLGGRIASMVADEAQVAGLVCLGYPFHPPARPEKLRTAHLEELETPTLIVQGTRDTFGRYEEVLEYNLSSSIVATFLEDGDHSFKPRVRSGRSLEQNLNQAVLEVSRFVQSLAPVRSLPSRARRPRSPRPPAPDASSDRG